MDRAHSASSNRLYNRVADTLGRPGNKLSKQPSSRVLRRCHSFNMGHVNSSKGDKRVQYSATSKRSYNMAADTLGRPGNKMSKQPSSRFLRRCHSFNLGHADSKGADNRTSRSLFRSDSRQLRRCPELRRATVPYKEKVPISEAERRQQRRSKSVEPRGDSLMDHRIHIPVENKPQIRDITRKLTKARSHLDDGSISQSSFDKTEAKLEGKFNDLVYTWVDPEEYRRDTVEEERPAPKRKQD